MDALRGTEKLLAQLSPAEKAQVLQWVARDLGGAYPSLGAEDLTNAWAYYRAHRDEIDEQIAANEAA